MVLHLTMKTSSGAGRPSASRIALYMARVTVASGSSPRLGLAYRRSFSGPFQQDPSGIADPSYTPRLRGLIARPYRCGILKRSLTYCRSQQDYPSSVRDENKRLLGIFLPSLDNVSYQLAKSSSTAFCLSAISGSPI